MNTPKVKDYTRLGGWLLLVAILCATRSIGSLFSWLINWQSIAMIWLPLSFLGMLSTGLTMTSFIMIIMRNRAARYLFAIGTATELILGIVMIVILDSLVGGGVYSPQLAAEAFEQLIFCLAGSIYLFCSRRVAVYFGEVQPMWYECGQAAPGGVQPPVTGAAMPGASAGPQPPVAPPYGALPQQDAALRAQPYGAVSQQQMNTAQPPKSYAPAQPYEPERPVSAPQPQPAAQSAPVCPACGMQGRPGAAFCTVCGTRLVQPAEKQPEVPLHG